MTLGGVVNRSVGKRGLPSRFLTGIGIVGRIKYAAVSRDRSRLPMGLARGSADGRYAINLVPAYSTPILRMRNSTLKAIRHLLQKPEQVEGRTKHT